MTFWKKGQRQPREAALVVASAASVEEARRVQSHFCKLTYDGASFVWTGFAGTVEAALDVADKIEAFIVGEKVW